MVAVSSVSADDGAGVLPDEPGYKLKIERERVELKATSGINERVRLYTRYAERRLEEADEMASRGKPEFVEDLLKEYRRYILRATDEIEQAQVVGYGVDTAIKEVERATEKHLSILEGLKTKVPEKALPAITRALDVSRKGRETALERLGNVQGREHPSGREDGAGRGSHGGRPSFDELPFHGGMHGGGPPSFGGGRGKGTVGKAPYPSGTSPCNTIRGPALSRTLPCGPSVYALTAMSPVSSYHLIEFLSEGVLAKTSSTLPAESIIEDSTQVSVTALEERFFMDNIPATR